MKQSTLIARCIFAFTLFFTLPAQSKQKITLIQSVSQAEELKSCVNLLTLPDGVPFPKIEFDNNRIPYFQFQSLDNARNFLTAVLKITKNDIEKRAQYLVLAMNGLREAYQKSNEFLTARDKLDIRTMIESWYTTLIQLRGIGQQLDGPSMDALYKIASRLTGSDMFHPLDNPLNLGNFSVLYTALNRPPPEKQLQKWLKAYPLAVAQVESYNVFCKFLELMPFLSLKESDTSRLVNAWLRRDEKLDPASAPSYKRGYALNDLFLLDPSSAYNYFIKHKSYFSSLDLDRPQTTARPFAYFKYVMKRSAPDLDIEFLKRYFQEFESEASATENMVGQFLSEFGIQFEQNVYDASVPFIEMDFFIQLADGRKINIEVDGPHHFIKGEDGTLQRRLGDLRRDEILKVMEIEVHRIPFFEVNNAKAMEERLMHIFVEGPKPK